MPQGHVIIAILTMPCPPSPADLTRLIHILDTEHPWDVHSINSGHCEAITCLEWDQSGEGRTEGVPAWRRETTVMLTLDSIPGSHALSFPGYITRVQSWNSSL